MKILFSGSICKLFVGNVDKLRADLLNYSTSLNMHQQNSSSIQVNAFNCWFNPPRDSENFQNIFTVLSHSMMSLSAVIDKISREAASIFYVVTLLEWNILKR